MMKNSLIISTGIMLSLSLTGCSMFSKVGKSARNMTRFGSQNKVAVKESLVIPPSLRQPASSNTPRRAVQRQTNSVSPRKAAYQSKRNYYVVVGTYPDQGQALDTFVRLSSIGLPGATMESRATKGGKILHMVRLGPYNNQEDIDKVKDSLTSDGLSQFKVVEN